MKTRTATQILKGFYTAAQCANGAEDAQYEINRLFAATTQEERWIPAVVRRINAYKAIIKKYTVVPELKAGDVLTFVASATNAPEGEHVIENVDDCGRAWFQANGQTFYAMPGLCFWNVGQAEVEFSAVVINNSTRKTLGCAILKQEVAVEEVVECRQPEAAPARSTSVVAGNLVRLESNGQIVKIDDVRGGFAYFAGLTCTLWYSQGKTVLLNCYTKKIAAVLIDNLTPAEQAIHAALEAVEVACEVARIEALSPEEWSAYNAAKKPHFTEVEAAPEAPVGFYAANNPNRNPEHSLTLANSYFGAWFYCLNQESMKVRGCAITTDYKSEEFIPVFNKGLTPREAYRLIANLGGLEPWRLELPTLLKEELQASFGYQMHECELSGAVNTCRILQDSFSRPGHSLQEMAENDNKRAVSYQKELATWMKKFRNDCGPDEAVTEGAKTPRKLSQVNDFIAAEFPGIKVHKGPATFFLYSDDDALGLKIAMLPTSSVHVNAIHHLTLQQWLESVRTLMQAAR